MDIRELLFSRLTVVPAYERNYSPALLRLRSGIFGVIFLRNPGVERVSRSANARAPITATIGRACCVCDQEFLE